MNKFWILESEYGFEYGQVTEGVENPEGSEEVNNFNQAEIAESQALARIEEAFNRFIEESNEGIDDDEDRDKENPGNGRK